MVGGVFLLLVVISTHKRVDDANAKLDQLLTAQDFSKEDQSVLTTTEQVHKAGDRIPHNP